MGWEVKQTCINAVISKYESSRNRCNDAWDEIFDAQTWWNMGLDHASLGHLIEAVDHNIYATYYSLCRNTFYTPNYGVPYFFTYHTEGEPFVLTWRAICEALAKDDFEGRYWAIAIIDHMRTLIWDKPFNIIWATKPEKE
ncbi:hypothetical protein ES703_16693 [subsurface metagenome]